MDRAEFIAQYVLKCAALNADPLYLAEEAAKAWDRVIDPKAASPAMVAAAVSVPVDVTAVHDSLGLTR